MLLRLRPAEKYEVLDTELMRQYPYLLCITFPVVASAISLVLGFFLMPESHPGLKGVKAPSCPQSFDEALKEPLLSTSEKVWPMAQSGVACALYKATRLHFGFQRPWDSQMLAECRYGPASSPLQKADVLFMGK